MNDGRLSRRQIQGWVANRFYYQENIPRKDAAILANCPDRRGAPAVDPPHPRPRRHHERGGRHRSLAALGRGGGTDARGGARRASSRPRRAVRRRRLRHVRPHPALGRGGGVVVDRAIRTGSDVRAPRRVRALLSLDRPGRPRLLPGSAGSGSPRRRARAGGGDRALPVNRANRRAPWRHCRSSATCSGASWTPSTGPIAE